MAHRFLLYIDILGFSALSKDRDRVKDLHEVVASLNLKAQPDFRAIVVSDTILVYNVNEAAARATPSLYISYLSGFASELQVRLLGKDIYFRAVLMLGDFNHYELNGIPFFDGDALVSAHQSVKEVKAIGLFIDTALARSSEVFSTEKFNDEFDFVCTAQGLEQVRNVYGGQVPLPRDIVEPADDLLRLSQDLLYLKGIYENIKQSHSFSVKSKFERTWQLFERRYPEVLSALVASRFDWNAISNGADWIAQMKLYPESFSSSIETRVDF